MSRFFAFWFTAIIALGVTAWILPGIRIHSIPALAVSALVLGALNSSIRPVLQLLALPITILTLGLFFFVVNGLVFGFAAWLVPGFEVRGFGWAFLGAMLMGLVSMFVGHLVSQPKGHRR